jgi:hypothetical protein
MGRIECVPLLCSFIDAFNTELGDRLTSISGDADEQCLESDPFQEHQRMPVHVAEVVINGHSKADERNVSRTTRIGAAMKVNVTGHLVYHAWEMPSGWSA